MTVTLQLANQVRRLGRENLTAPEIAGHLALPETQIMETLTILGLPLPGETFERRAGPTDEERAAGARRSRLPSEALIEFDLGCRLGVRVELTRPGIGQVPQRRAAGRRDARWRGGKPRWQPRLAGCF
jgi:hypothetical protein